MAITLLPRFQERTVHKPYAILAVLQMIDILSTWIVLEFWSERAEGNPVAAWILNGLGLYLGLGLMLALKLFAVWVAWNAQAKVRLVTAIYGLVVVNNLLFLGLWLWSVTR